MTTGSYSNSNAASTSPSLAVPQLSSAADAPNVLSVPRSNEAPATPTPAIARDFGAWPRWVIWRYEFRRGRITKVPYSPLTHRCASVQRPSDWVDLAAAGAALRPPGHYQGVGFVFADGDGMVGIDLDACVAEDRTIAPWALECLSWLPSYAECSPSRTGIKVFCRGIYRGDRHKVLIDAPPVIDGKAPAIEIYAAARYFTVTGWEYAGPREVTNCQPGIDWIAARYFSRPVSSSLPHAEFDHDPDVRISPQLSDTEVVDKCLQGRNADKFRRLHANDSADYGDDLSRCDMAYVGMLAVYTQDPNQIARIWRNFRFREKLNRDDYVFFFTIARALRNLRRPWRPDVSPASAGQIRNYETITGDDGNVRRAGKRLPIIANELWRNCDGFPKVVRPADGGDEMLFAVGENGAVLNLNSPPRLFAWMGDSTPVDWTKGSSCHTKVEFSEYLRMNAETYVAVETCPHFPPIASHYYVHDEIVLGGGEYLDRFLRFFCPLTPIDAQLMKAFVMQLFWGGAYGCRPAWLIVGPDNDSEAGRGVGKTAFIQKCGALVGGFLAFTESSFNSPESIQVRLLSDAGRRKRLALIDNLKSLRFSSSMLEALITSANISGKQHYVGEGCRPSDLTWAITVNSANLSRDLAQRCFMIKVARPRQTAGAWDNAVDGSKTWRFPRSLIGARVGGPGTDGPASTRPPRTWRR